MHGVSHPMHASPAWPSPSLAITHSTCYPFGQFLAPFHCLCRNGTHATRNTIFKQPSRQHCSYTRAHLVNQLRQPPMHVSKRVQSSPRLHPQLRSTTTSRHQMPQVWYKSRITPSSTPLISSTNRQDTFVSATPSRNHPVVLADWDIAWTTGMRSG